MVSMMQVSCVPFVFVLTGLLACSAVGEDGKLHWTRPLIQARLDSQQTRLNSLSERLDHMMEEVKESRDVGHVQEKLQQLVERVEQVEANDCPNENFVSCGRNSGQCVHELLFCNDYVDCENGFDEANETCENRITPGTSFNGYMYFERCFTRGAGYGKDYLTCTITSNTPHEYLPSRLRFTAMCAWSWQRNGKLYTETYTNVGMYIYGKRQIYFASGPEFDVDGRLYITGVIRDGLLPLYIYNEADLTLCGTSFLGVR